MITQTKANPPLILLPCTALIKGHTVIITRSACYAQLIPCWHYCWTLTKSISSVQQSYLCRHLCVQNISRSKYIQRGTRSRLALVHIRNKDQFPPYINSVSTDIITQWKYSGCTPSNLDMSTKEATWLKDIECRAASGELVITVSYILYNALLAKHIF